MRIIGEVSGFSTRRLVICDVRQINVASDNAACSARKAYWLQHLQNCGTAKLLRLVCECQLTMR